MLLLGALAVSVESETVVSPVDSVASLDPLPVPVPDVRPVLPGSAFRLSRVTVVEPVVALTASGAASTVVDTFW